MPEDVKPEQQELNAALGDAVKAIRACVEDFAKLAAAGRESASEAMRQAGAEAAGGLGALSEDAQDRLDRGAAELSRMAAAHPLAALAIAAGAGFLLARAARGGAK